MKKKIKLKKPRKKRSPVAPPIKVIESGKEYKRRTKFNEEIIDLGDLCG